MKKILGVIILLLALMISLTAGTMASYSQTVPLSANITTKSFGVSASRPAGFSDEAISIAPGSEHEWHVSIVNEGQVSVLMVARASFVGLPDIAGMTISINDGSKNAQGSTSVLLDSNTTVLKQGEKRDYVIRIDYSSDQADIKDSGKSYNINFLFNANQK